MSRGRRFSIAFECPIIVVVEAAVEQSIFQPRGTAVLEHTSLYPDLWKRTIFVHLFFLEIDQNITVLQVFILL